MKGVLNTISGVLVRGIRCIGGGAGGGGLLLDAELQKKNNNCVVVLKSQEHPPPTHTTKLMMDHFHNVQKPNKTNDLSLQQLTRICNQATFMSVLR